MIKATYLRDDYYFNNLEEAVKYYQLEEENIMDLIDLQDALKEEAEGMAYPILEEI